MDVWTHHSTISCNSYISSKVTNTYQNTTNRNNLQKGLYFCLSYGKLLKEPRAKERTYADYDRRVTYRCGGSQEIKSLRGDGEAHASIEAIARIQNHWRRLACQHIRFRAVSSTTEEHSRQIKKAGRYQLINNVMAARMLLVDWYPSSNILSSLRRLTLLCTVLARKSNPCITNRPNDVLIDCGGGWRCIP